MNDDKWGLRARRGQAVILGPDGLVGTSMAQIKQFQSEFQTEYCPSCANFDQDAQKFRQTRHTRFGPNDCHDHWTDIIGQCWNYRRARPMCPTGVQDSGIEGEG